MKKIDVVLPCYIFTQDLWDLAKNAVSSLKQLKHIGKLIIIDNGSTMAGGWMREMADIYIRVDKNMGYAPAMNMGLKLTSSEYVALAETDIRAPENAFVVANEILKDNNVGSIHFRMVGYDEPIITGDKTWLTGRERWCTISFCVFRKKAMGLFDENYIQANYEDYDIIYNMRNIKGWKTAYTNRVCYQHKHSYTQRQLDQTERQKWADHNKEYFKKKWGEEPDKLFQSIYPEQWKIPWLPFQ